MNHADRDPPSALSLFRCASLLAIAAIGLQNFAPFWFAAPPGIPISPVLLAGLQLAASAAMMLAFWRRTAPAAGRSPPTGSLLLGVQLALGMTLSDGWLLILAAELALVLPQRSAFVWLGVQLLLYLGIRHAQLHDGRDAQLLGCGLLGSGSRGSVLGGQFSQQVDYVKLALYQLIAFGVAYAATLEQRTRTRLAAAHADMAATQQLLADTIRANERVKVARNLHDAIGHHLTALNLHLELAYRHGGNEASAPLQASRSLAQRLLAEVREMVSRERHAPPSQLRQALATLCAGYAAPHIELSFDDALATLPPEQAHTLFLCTQCAIRQLSRCEPAERLHVALFAHGEHAVIRVVPPACEANAMPAEDIQLGLRDELADLGDIIQVDAAPNHANGIEIRLSRQKGPS